MRFLNCKLVLFLFERNEQLPTIGSGLRTIASELSGTLKSFMIYI